LATSGIDISKFKGHSTSAADVSASDRAGGPIKDFMSAAGWSSNNTFAKFVKKSVQTGNEFAKSICKVR
jgi:hypothetical protein